MLPSVLLMKVAFYNLHIIPYEAHNADMKYITYLYSVFTNSFYSGILYKYIVSITDRPLLFIGHIYIKERNTLLFKLTRNSFLLR